jgi:ATP-dependent DNA helicase RecQ
MIRRCKHEKLSTYGLLRDLAKKQLQSLVYQLVDQGLLARTPGDRPILKLNEASWEVLRGKRDVKLLRPKQKAPARAEVDAESWEGVDRGLFEHLRQWRLATARERQVPPYIVLDDAALRSLARLRPTRMDSLKQVRGIGEKRMADFGESLIGLIGAYCKDKELAADQAVQPDSTDGSTVKGYIKPKSPNAVKAEATPSA